MLTLFIASCSTCLHADVPAFRHVGLSAKFSVTPGAIDAPPTLGQHQQEILGQLGYSTEEIKAMKEKAAI